MRIDLVDIKPQKSTQKKAMKTVSTLNAEHYPWGQGCEGWRLLKGDDLSVIQERVPYHPLPHRPAQPTVLGGVPSRSRSDHSNCASDWGERFSRQSGRATAHPANREFCRLFQR